MVADNSDVSRLDAVVVRELTRMGVEPGSALLVAFSGGADSTALLVAACKAGYSVKALHCNFHLRGDESDRDENFCRQVAAKLGVELSVHHFDVASRVAQTGESVEMAARELRYDWFAREHQSSAAPLLTAHHSGDNVETFFLNLLRGSGLRGLAGIPEKRGYILRPFLGVPKEDMLAYLAAHDVDYVTDSTNLKSDFRRNMLRLEIIPDIERRFPGAVEAVERSVANLRRDLDLLNGFVEAERKRRTGAFGELSVEGLGGAAADATLLFHMLGGALDHATVERILAHPGASGKVFEGSGGVRYLLDRGNLIKVEGEGVSQPPVIKMDLLAAEEFSPSRDPWEIWLDGSVLDMDEARWELRQWRHADRIAPFGMRGTRPVSSIIAEAKVPLTAKGNVWVLTCDGEPVWVVGYRASRHFVVTPLSDKVVRLRAKPN